jgi:mannose-6-phosphate isomerase-like protein (cupin superfamily)
MADFTKVNLNGEVEDAAPKFDMSPEVEAHFGHDDLDATVTGLSYQRLEPNARMPFGHSHEKQEEIYLVLSGRGRIKLDEEIVDLAPLDAVRIAAPTMWAVEAGSEGIEYVVFGVPRGDQNDAQMVQEWWAQTDG